MLPSSHRNAEELEQRRLNAAKFFKKKLKDAEIARRLGVSRAAVHYWHLAWRKGGGESLKTAKPGPKPRLTEAKKRKIERTLLKGPISFGYTTEIWTLERIAAAVRKTTGIFYHPGHVWYVLRGLNWTCQKPETQAKEKDMQAVRRWMKTGFPRVQKGGGNGARE